MAKAQEKEAQLTRMMTNLGLSRDEAIALMADDEAIDHGERMDFDLSAEQERESKKARGTGTKTKKKPTNYQFETRKRKENSTKRDLISRMAELLENSGEVEITNPERTIQLKIDDNIFEITLSQKRKPKGSGGN